LIAHGSLGGRWPNVGDPTAEDLIERNGLTERNSGKDTDLGHYVVSVHIVRRVRFRVAPGLRVRQGSGVFQALGHQGKDVVCRTVEDPAQRNRARSSQAVSNRAQHGSAGHNRRFHAAFHTMLSRESEQF